MGEEVLNLSAFLIPGEALTQTPGVLGRYGESITLHVCRLGGGVPEGGTSTSLNSAAGLFLSVDVFEVDGVVGGSPSMSCQR